MSLGQTLGLHMVLIIGGVELTFKPGRNRLNWVQLPVPPPISSRSLAVSFSPLHNPAWESFKEVASLWVTLMSLAKWQIFKEDE